MGGIRAYVVFSVFFLRCSSFCPSYLNGFIQSKPLYSHKPVLGFVEAATSLKKKAAFYAPLGLNLQIAVTP
jgi:hypothetical protein